MKTIEDLNTALFAQLDRLTAADLSKEKLNFEVARTRSIIGISAQIITNLTLLQKVKDVNDKSQILPIKQKEYALD